MSRRDLIFSFLAFTFSFFAILMMINIFGGPALGAPTILEKAHFFLFAGVLATTVVAICCTQWIGRGERIVARAVIGGAVTVLLSVIIGILIFFFSYGSVLPISDLLMIFLTGLAFLPLGMTTGACVYGIRRRS